MAAVRFDFEPTGRSKRYGFWSIIDISIR